MAVIEMAIPVRELVVSLALVLALAALASGVAHASFGASLVLFAPGFVFSFCLHITYIKT